MKNDKKTIGAILIYVLLLIPLFKPVCVTVLSNTINNVYNVVFLLDAMIIIALYILKAKCSKNIIYTIIFIIVLIVSTILNNGELNNCIMLGIKILTLCLIVEFGVKRNTKTFLIAFEFILSILVYINFITLLIYPKGMYMSYVSGYSSNWFLGFKNIHILYILPAILLNLINNSIASRKITVRTCTLLMVSTFSMIRVWSATGIVGIVLCLLYIFLPQKVKNAKFFYIKNYIITEVSLFLGIVMFRIQNLFSYIIVDLLKKDLTFTGRTIIWDYIIEYIKQKPLLGYGIESTITRFSKGTLLHSYHAHNIILELIYKTGLIGLFIIILIIVDVKKQLGNFKENVVARHLAFWIFIYMIISLTEAYDMDMFFFIFTLAANVKYLVKDREEN